MCQDKAARRPDETFVTAPARPQDCPQRDKTPLSLLHYDWYLVLSLVDRGSASRIVKSPSHLDPILVSDLTLSDLQLTLPVPQSHLPLRHGKPLTAVS